MTVAVVVMAPVQAVAQVVAEKAPAAVTTAAELAKPKTTSALTMNSIFPATA